MSKSGKAGVISPMHAVLRCLIEFAGIPMDQDSIIEKFQEVGSNRIWNKATLNEALGLGVREGFVENIDEIGWKITEAGRGEIGPMIETELKYI